MRLAVLAVLLTASFAHGQAPQSWVGQRAFTQFGAVLHKGDGTTDDEGRSISINVSGHDRATMRIYRVEHANGPWLWLKDENSGVEGWVDYRSVVPYDQAIDFYTNQIRAHPSSSLYNRRGRVWKERGETDIAIADYSEAIRLDPTNETAYNNRGSLWSYKKEYDKAIADYSEALRLDPKFATAYNNRGTAWEYKGEYDKAIADYSEAIRLDSKDETAYSNRGDIWTHKKEYDRAIADYSEALRLDPKCASAYSGRGAVRERRGEFDQAIADCTGLPSRCR